jgi:hypothetical protein
VKFGNLIGAANKIEHKVLDLYEEYLSHRDLKAEAEAILHIVTKNDRRDRVGTWSASSSGSCLRQQQLTFLGVEQRLRPLNEQNIFFNGDYLHLRYQVAGLIDGWLSDVEVPVVHQTVRGTMDGLYSWGEIAEFKSINDRGYTSVNEFGPKASHVRQVTAYMLATGVRTARFIYENKNTNATREFLYEFDEGIAASVQAEWEELNDLAARRQLAPMIPACREKKGFDYNYCPFKNVCEKSTWPAIPRFVFDGK